MPNLFAGKSINKTSLKKILLIFLISVKWLFIVAVISGFMAAGASVGYVAALVKDDPVRSKAIIMQKMDENAVTGFVYFADDSVIGQLRSEEDRRLAELNEIPKIVKDAFLSIEDNHFYEHYGVDMKGFLRAVKQKLLKEEVQTGGSTITQQLARRVFLSLDRSTNRKAKELFLSLRLERMMSKDEIFLAYLTKIPFGNGSNGYNLYGVKAAAKGIFNIDDLHRLNVAQAAYLAGLPQQPSTYSAFTGKGDYDNASFKKALVRQQLVLKRMLEEGAITNQQYQEALQFDLKSSLAEPQKKAYNTYPYLMLEAERNAAELLLKSQQPNVDKLKPNEYNEALKEARELLLHSGYKIFTTIDKEIYDSMKAIAADDKNFSPKDAVKGVEQVGAIMIENKTGAILGMIEGRGFEIEQMNLATQMIRQPGSTMKPIAAYLPALEKGAIAPGDIIDDVPIILRDGTKGVHLPENWNGKFHGLITARRALNQSYNIPAIKLFLYEVGMKEAWDFTRSLGITSITKDDYIYAQTGVIGGLQYGVSIKELTGAYASIPSKGIANQPFLIRKIVDAEGNAIYSHESQPKSVYSEETAYLMTDMLRTVITSGTATDLTREFKHYSKIPVAGKTGSTQDDADAWFMGFSPDITVGVWAGYEQQKHTLSKKNCAPGAGCGTQRAKKVWAKIMDSAISKKPDLFATKEFTKPENIVEMTVSNVSGKLPNDLTIQADRLVTDIFNKKYIPLEEDDVMVKMNYVTYNQKNYLPLPTTPADMIQEKIVIKREKPVSLLIKEIEAALQQLPEDKRQPIEHYYPEDYGSDAPFEEDPRKEDGKNPDPPANLALAKTSERVELTFSASGNEDVLGYRVYRSVNRGPFQKLNGKAVLTGQDNKFVDTVFPSSVYGYYLTAVDLAGKESAASQAIFTDGHRMDPLLFPPFSMGNGSNNHEFPADVPSAPTQMQIKSEGVGVRISWAANPQKDSVKKFDVYYSDKEKGVYKKLHSTSETNFSYYALVYDGWYYVIAVNERGVSKPSKPLHYKP